ncbi:defensin-like protein 276 [Ziziphus jujuba]|uniref:Defensin-like protein 276 n=1 Tax=Ziziphus jujuba TaxID=326968 RepID=A0A6P6GK60_ZIZJJ|nr:defensin-like protein 276 [Ziziphus jujuba]
MSSSKPLLFAALLVLLVFHYANGDPSETDLCNFEDDSDLDNNVSTKNVMDGCHFSCECKTAEDCSHPCAALGLDPNAAKCIGNRCCCI